MSVSAAADCVWAGTYGGGLFRIVEGRAVPEPVEGVTVVQSVLAARDGQVWAGTLLAARCGAERIGEIEFTSAAQMGSSVLRFV